MKQFDYAAFKRGFREAAARRGIDPVTGLTDAQYATSKPSTYQVALENAQVRKDHHHEQQRQLVWLKAEDQFARRVWWSEGRGFLKDSGAMDMDLIDKAESKFWWAQDPEMWNCNWEPLRDYQISEFEMAYLEDDACTELRHQIAYRKGQAQPADKRQEARDLVREVLTENPTQAAMQVSYFKRPLMIADEPLAT